MALGTPWTPFYASAHHCRPRIRTLTALSGAWAAAGLVIAAGAVSVLLLSLTVPEHGQLGLRLEAYVACIVF